MTTLVQGRTEIKARGYARFTDARLTTWLNTAKNRFEDYPFDWPWLKSTATGAAPLTVTDLRRVRSVVDTSNLQTLEGREAEDVIDYLDDSLTTTGRPAWWYLSSETAVSVFPVQTVGLSVRYVKFSPELSADGDTPLIPARYSQTWLDLAEIEVLRFGVKDSAGAKAMEQDVFARLAEIADVYGMQGVPVHDETLVTGASTDG